MKILTTILTALMLVAMASVARAAQLDQTFRTSHDFTIHLPSGWVQVPKAEIDRHLGAIHNQYPNAPRENFDYAYQLDSSEYWLYEHPYIMIQVRNTGKIMQPPEKVFQEMKERVLKEATQEFNKKMNQDQNLMSFLETASLDDSLVDWDIPNHVMWMVMRSRVANLGPIATVVAICLTEKGVIRVGLAVKESEFASYLPIFRQIVSSIEYGPTLKYRSLQHHVPMKSGEEIMKSVLSGLWAAVGAWSILSLLVTLIAVVIAGIINWQRKA